MFSFIFAVQQQKQHKLWNRQIKKLLFVKTATSPQQILQTCLDSSDTQKHDRKCYFVKHASLVAPQKELDLISRHTERLRLQAQLQELTHPAGFLRRPLLEWNGTVFTQLEFLMGWEEPSGGKWPAVHTTGLWRRPHESRTLTSAALTHKQVVKVQRRLEIKSKNPRF